MPSRKLPPDTAMLPDQAEVAVRAIVRLKQEPNLRVVDVRSREEFEAVHLPGSVLLSQTVMREILGDGSNTRPVVLYR